MSDVPSTVPPEYLPRLEAARVVAGCVLAGMRGGEDAGALLVMGLDEFETYELADAAFCLIVGLLHSTAKEWGEDPYAVAQRWALKVASEPAAR